MVRAEPETIQAGSIRSDPDSKSPPKNGALPQFYSTLLAVIIFWQDRRDEDVLSPEARYPASRAATRACSS